ncbi:MAG: phospho-sugar mutase [Oscillospiraceae bacterium]|nr:phospho-sugar mutase [Oscillospiraceae bacterium]
MISDYEAWLKNAVEDDDLVNELESIKGNDAQINDRFYTSLKFGTAGLRGKIGAGTNRMNIYVVRHATQGLANYILKNNQSGGVAIAYDSRIKADLFAKECARVLAANGIKVFLVKELQPTPVLSFLVRHFGCSAGIMVTASHNPASDNGYKVYGDDGCQMTDAAADAVYSEIKEIDTFTGVKLADFEAAVNSGLIEYVDDSVYDLYLEQVKKQQIDNSVLAKSDIKIAFTPLNGTGNKLVRKVLAQLGAKNVFVVEQQEQPDGNFTTCSYPNPEKAEALKLGLELAQQKDADILMATDPDADRVGVAVKDGDGYRRLTGNEVGILLVDYILSGRKKAGTMPKDAEVVKTIVSSILVDRICAEYGVAVKNVLTGFKYIGDEIKKLEQAGKAGSFVFGFEESCGYLAGSYVRDKDAVFACMMIAEMAAAYKMCGDSVAAVLDSLYEKYGFYKNTTLTFSFPGVEGTQKMADIMDGFRNNPLDNLSGYDVVKISDYEVQVSKDIATGKTEQITLPKSNVIAFGLEGNNAVIIRPSGTEPKIKLYITAVGKTLQGANAVTVNFVHEMVGLFGRKQD